MHSLHIFLWALFTGSCLAVMNNGGSKDSASAPSGYQYAAPQQQDYRPAQPQPQPQQQQQPQPTATPPADTGYRYSAPQQAVLPLIGAPAYYQQSLKTPAVAIDVVPRPTEQHASAGYENAQTYFVPRPQENYNGNRYYGNANLNALGGRNDQGSIKADNGNMYGTTATTTTTTTTSNRPENRPSRTQERATERPSLAQNYYTESQAEYYREPARITSPEDNYYQQPNANSFQSYATAQQQREQVASNNAYQMATPGLAQSFPSKSTATNTEQSHQAPAGHVTGHADRLPYPADFPPTAGRPELAPQYSNFGEKLSAPVAAFLNDDKQPIDESSAYYLQMQSHSYELPYTSSIYMEMPQRHYQQDNRAPVYQQQAQPQQQQQAQDNRTPVYQQEQQQQQSQENRAPVYQQQPQPQQQSEPQTASAAAQYQQQHPQYQQLSNGAASAITTTTNQFHYLPPSAVFQPPYYK